MDTKETNKSEKVDEAADSQQLDSGSNTTTAGSKDLMPEQSKDKRFETNIDDEERQQLYSVTEKLHISQHFEWLERRQEMAEVIRLLQEKKVLFIRCPNRDHFHRSTQRLATTLQTMDHWRPKPPAPLRINKPEQKLKPFFWKDFTAQSVPVIIILHYHYLEYIKALLAVDDKEVEMDIIHPLASKNIYLICPLPDEANVRQLIGEKRVEGLLEHTYACWKMPVVKLELIKRYGANGMDLLQRLQEDNDLQALLPMKQYYLLEEIPFETPEAILLEKMKEANIAYVGQLDNGVKYLIDLLEGEDALAHAIIFTVAFFPGINKEDFQNLVEYQLGTETELQATGPDAKPPRLLKELWASRAVVRQYLVKCRLQADDREGRVTIDFTVHGLRDNIRKIITKNFRFMYFDIFESLVSSGLLFKPDVPPSIREAIIHFLVPAATKITDCHDSDWLTGVFFMNLRNVVENIVKEDEEIGRVIRSAPELLSDAIMAKILNVAGTNKMLRDSITADMTLLFSDMIKAENKVFHTTLNAFVRKLIDLYRIDETGLDIILPIYKKILTDNIIEEKGPENGRDASNKEDGLTRDGLINYFSKALEKGTTGQMFEAYNKMQQHFGRWGFLKISSDWINDKAIKQQSWTKKMAWFFQLDFCIYSFNNHFSKKEKGVYELFDDPQEIFTDDFTSLVKHITESAFMEACNELLRYKDAFIVRAFWLENYVTNINPLIQRIDEQYKKAYTLSADIIENWFYILAADEPLPESDNIPSWSIFAGIVVREAFPKTLKEILLYWRNKAGIYSQTILVVNRIKNKDEKEKKIKTLKLRRACLRKLTDIISAQSKK